MIFIIVQTTIKFYTFYIKSPVEANNLPLTQTKQRASLQITSLHLRNAFTSSSLVAFLIT
ncbi:hypothetical protein [Veillonella sp. oral taxon 780]|uniref:hypothetical protein n=1 Tax=Veillonella sp. oral taxon 780 TaxID=671229 RepID=UPI00350E5867